MLSTMMRLKGDSNLIDTNELLKLAIEETENLYDGEVFLVKELFKGYEWNRIPVKELV